MLNRQLSSGLEGPYDSYLETQAATTYLHNRNLLSQYGIHFAGPIVDVPNASTQQSSLEALVAVIPSLA